MTDKTAARRNAELRRRKRAEGLVTATVVIPETRRAELQEIARQWRDEHAGQATTDNPEDIETVPCQRSSGRRP